MAARSMQLPSAAPPQGNLALLNGLGLGAHDLKETTVCCAPHAFIDKMGNPIVITPLRQNHAARLTQLYLNYTPKDSFAGLPPVRQEDCVAWVHGMIRDGINLVALCFDEGVVGHAALFSVDSRRCEMLIGVAKGHQDAGIGTELTRRIIQLAYELEFEEIWLSVEVKNRVAQHVYAKCGFEHLAREEIDELEMVLSLRRLQEMDGVTVERVMNKNVVTVSERHTWKEALHMFLESRVGSLPVVDCEGRVVGILSQTDLLVGGNDAVRVGDILTRQTITVRPSWPLSRAVRLFQSKRMRCIPVVDGAMRLVGVIGRRDILAFYGGHQV